MVEPTGYYLQAGKLIANMVEHGWGEMTVRVESLKDGTVKVVLVCGLSHVHFIKKNTFEFRDVI